MVGRRGALDGVRARAVAGVRRNPYPVYALLRRLAPVFRAGRSGWWVVSRYADAARVLGDPGAFSSTIMAPADPALLGADPPAHTRVRRALTRALTPARLAALQLEIGERARARVAALRGEVDLVERLAGPLPVEAAARLLGIDPAREEDFRRWSRAVVVAATAPPGAPRPAELARHQEEFDRFFAELVAWRGAEPGDDLVSDLARGGELGPDEILSVARLLLIAGTETATHLIGNTLLALLRRPRLLARVRTDGALLRGVVEESLRHDSPVQFVLRRAACAAQVGGRTVPAGARVVVLLAAANRDPRRFPRPARFDPRRDARGTLAFGSGCHHCLGAALARIEAAAAVGALLDAFPRPRLARPGGRVEWIDSVQLRGPRELRVRLG